MALLDEAALSDLEMSAKCSEREKFCIRSLLIDQSQLSIKKAYIYSRPTPTEDDARAGSWFRSDKVQAYLRVLKRNYAVGNLSKDGKLEGVEIRSKEDLAKLYQQMGDQATDVKTRMEAYKNFASIMGYAKGANQDTGQVAYHISLRCFDCTFWNMQENGILYFDKEAGKWRIRE